MEFRYRAIDTNRPPPATVTAPPSHPPTPNLSFFSPPSILGLSDDQVREVVIQREIEKEQIRQEIIIAEAARKRELIAEVLQEMAIEREMAKRRVAETGMSMSLEEKITMWINQRKVLNQNQNQNQNQNNLVSSMMCTSPMMQLPQPQNMVDDTTGTSVLESNKEKLIVLNRADTIGEKPKADSVGTMQLPQLQKMPEATGTSVSESNKEKLIVLARADPVGAKRKAEDTQTGLEKDLQVKKQKAEEAVLEAKTMSVETGEIVSSKLPCSGEIGSEKKVEIKLRSNFTFWCEICNVGAFSQKVMREHESGKKHKAAVITQQQNEAPEAASTSLAPASGSAPQSEAISVIENANVPSQKVDETTGKKIEEGEKKKKVTFWCDTCKIQTNSETMMRNHKLGKKHMALVEKRQRKPITVLPVSAADSEEKESISLAMDHTKGKDHCLDKHIRAEESETCT
ncbi:uncharacterized protein LOC17889134 isoform X2 [Capsella rubella]|nr:uncharacterized protein LOC17889134 isoform X2 [Capsella rubella]